MNLVFGWKIVVVKGYCTGCRLRQETKDFRTGLVLLDRIEHVPWQKR